MRAWLSRTLAAGAAVFLLLGGQPVGAVAGERAGGGAAVVAAHGSGRTAQASGSAAQASGRTAVIAVYPDREQNGEWGHATFHPSESAVPQVASALRTVGAEVVVGDFSTRRSTAYFWSGLGAGGEDIAERIATERKGVTLGMLLEQRNITMPTWDGSQKVEVAWSAVSEEYARQASGVVHVILGPYVRPNAIWYTEFENLKRNAKVSKVVSVDSQNGSETTLYTRGEQPNR
ncbi:hypothetical protein ACIQ6Y_12470 [Streptomyces sp. NPDC096205]|uniref:hypothetical protein n=1 Tax=Streptomyces sp. NPDC096205 TaxID=3366081 RepID=UPI0037F49412